MAKGPGLGSRLQRWLFGRLAAKTRKTGGPWHGGEVVLAVPKGTKLFWAIVVGLFVLTGLVFLFAKTVIGFFLLVVGGLVALFAAPVALATVVVSEDGVRSRVPLIGETALPWDAVEESLDLDSHLLLVGKEEEILIDKSLDNAETLLDLLAKKGKTPKPPEPPPAE